MNDLKCVCSHNVKQVYISVTIIKVKKSPNSISIGKVCMYGRRNFKA